MEAKDKINEDSSILRAAIKKSDKEEKEDHDFSAVAVPSDNKKLMYSYRNEEYFHQVLMTGKDNIVSKRLDSGLPLFDNHPYDNSVVNTLGKTIGYEFTERGLEVKIKLGARADEALKKDIENEIINTVSIEGFVEEYQIERMPNEIPIYYAMKWEPTSLSFAPVPNDIGAQIEIKRAIENQIKSKIKENTVFNSLTNKF